MKRKTALFLCMALVIGSLAGCGNSMNDAAKPADTKTETQETKDEPAEQTAEPAETTEETTEEVADEDMEVQGAINSPDFVGLVDLVGQLKDSSKKASAPDWTEYDSLIAQIKAETDYAKREALMHQAEDILMSTGGVIPIYYYNDVYMQRSTLDNIYSNLYGFKFFMYTTGTADGVLKLQLASEPAYLDPALNSSVDGACLAVNSFAGLYTYDKNMNLVPQLADSYTVSDDGLTYTFTMKKDLKWSDGSPLTAEDVVYAWQRCANPETGADYAYMFDGFALNADGLVDATADDDVTVTCHLTAPCAYFLDLMAFPAFYPVPKAVVEKCPADNPGKWAQEAGFVSSGAFTLKEWKHDESMVYVKNPNYYDAANVTLDEMDFMLSADDTAIYSAYKSGDVDFIDSVPTDEIQSLLNDPEFHIVDNLGTYYIAFNVNSDLFAGKTAQEAAYMRLAISLLIDREYIAENIGQTGQQPATSYIPAGMMDGNGGVFKTNDADYTYPCGDGYYPAAITENNREAAIELLMMAGYEFDENGMLSSSTPIALNYLTNDGTGHIKIAEAIQQDLADIGIQMTIASEEWNVFLDDRKAGNFDFAREGWLADFNDPINMLEMFMTESGNNDPQFGR
ncbi:MAG: peptide ABC transporter substrate-binding protein [Lachnospiraceae bacterium]|nr:peptide ABC transporter substrate-binding protein [Lachnospiraceae bacterium]